MSLEVLLTFLIASFAIIIVPGPTVTVIIANSIRSGASAGLMNVAGTQVALVPIVFLVAFGLETLLVVMGEAFFWIKLFGAAYLIWLGGKLLRSNGDLGNGNKAKSMSMRGYFWQGMLVAWSNPKVAVFFGAFLPQFVDHTSGTAFWQIVGLGFLFIVVATISDGAYALLAGKAGTMLTRSRVRIVEVLSGLFLVGGGIWLALVKRA